MKVDPTWGCGCPSFGAYQKSQFVHQAIYGGFNFAVKETRWWKNSTGSPLPTENLHLKHTETERRDTKFYLFFYILYVSTILCINT